MTHLVLKKGRSSPSKKKNHERGPASVPVCASPRNDDEMEKVGVHECVHVYVCIFVFVSSYPILVRAGRRAFPAGPDASQTPVRAVVL